MYATLEVITTLPTSLPPPTLSPALYRRLFNWLAYILLLYNCFVGLLNAVARIALSFVISVLLIIRLDRVVLMRGFEFLDFGEYDYT